MTSNSGVFWIGLLGLVFAMSACGDDGAKSGKCPDNQEYATVDTVTGCWDICQAGVCGAGASCTQGICIPTAMNNTTTNNTTTNNVNNLNNLNNANNLNNTTNNTTTNNTTTNNTNTNNTNTNNVTIDPAVTVLCEQACDLLYGSCITNNCNLAQEDLTALANIEATCLGGSNGGPTCAEEGSSNAQLRASLEQFVTQTCDDLKPLRCGELGLTSECGCATPSNLGSACTMDTQCDGGDIDGFCVPETDMDGNATGFPGGYCLAAPCRIPPDVQAPFAYESSVCGGGVCTIRDDQQGGTFSFCRAACSASCRNGYACQVVGFKPGAVQGSLGYLESCLPTCVDASDCGANSRCSQGSCQLECGNTPLGGQQGAPTLTEICQTSGGTCQTDGVASYCVLP